MKMTKLCGLVVACSLAFSGLVCCPTLHAAAPIPKVTGPIPVADDSYPFNAASRSTVPQDLSRSGYIEEEYLVSGSANVYDLDSQGKAVVKTPDAPYTTRILVRRPAAPESFSGTVVVELLNPTMRCDLDLQWQFSSEYFLARKDVWVGITSKPVAALALRAFDPKRYGTISWANPVPADKTCDPVSPFNDSTKENENGLVWDMASQVGALVKSNSPQSPLKGFSVKRAYLTGYSQTGGYLMPYINFIRPLPTATLASGKPVYDGYLIGDGEGMGPPLNQCGAPAPPGTPLSIIQPRSEPVISLVTQCLLGLTLPARRPDSDSPGDRYRRYEVPGAAHITPTVGPQMVRPEDAAKAGVKGPPPNCKELSTYGMTDFPLEYFMDAAFANLDEWVRSNTPPPKAAVINAKAAPGMPIALVESDKYGNAIGGIRCSYLEVPVATYHANSTPGDPASMLPCLLSGYKVPLSKDSLATLYPTHEAYVKKVVENVDGLVKERLLTKTDGEKIKKEAAAAAVP
jgi:hypothetical protein